MKFCKKCSTEKTLAEFSKGNGRDGLNSWCKACATESSRKSKAKKKAIRDAEKQKLIDAELKACCICKEIKSYDEFNNAKNHSDGKASRCKPCEKEYKRKHYLENKKQINAKNAQWHWDNHQVSLERKRQYYHENKDRFKPLFAAYRKENADYISKWKIKHYRKNRAEVLAKQKEYRKKNRERYNAWERKRYRENPQANIANKCRGRINSAIKSAEKGALKASNTIDLLGCTFAEFKTHIEKQFTKGMSWKKVMSNEIHLDHITPISSFDLTDPEQQYQAFNYLNVMPLWSKDNLSKGSKITLLI